MRFHSKKHNKNHHSSATGGYPDSASDPIGSYEQPFQGEFVLTGPLSAQTASFVNAISDLVVDNITINNTIPTLTVDNIIVNNDITSPNATLEGDGSTLTNVDAATFNGSNFNDFELIANKNQPNGYVGLDYSNNIINIDDIAVTSINNIPTSDYLITGDIGITVAPYLTSVDWDTNSADFILANGTITSSVTEPFLFLKSPLSGARISLQSGPDDVDGPQSDAYHKAQGHHFMKSVTEIDALGYAETDTIPQSSLSSVTNVTIGGDGAGFESINIWGKGVLTETGTEPNHLVTKQYVDSKSVDVGFFDYNASGALSAVSLTQNTWENIENDAGGQFTLTSYGPNGVTRVWDEVADSFDWSELKLGDMVDIRVDVEVTTNDPNSTIELDLVLAEASAGEYRVPFLPSNIVKTAGTTRIVEFNSIYMGNTLTLNNPAHFQIRTDDSNATMNVHGWYCKVIIV
jgi:hypothetical protein